MTNVPTITGARLIAETLHGYEDLGIRRIVTHSEKAAAYMADGFARVSGRPGVCMAQSVGAANLAAGLQDAYLGCSPVIALTGRKPPAFQHRNAYQEIAHGPLFDPVTKYNVNVSTMEQLVHYLCQAFREATCGTPRPVHLDVLGHRGDDIELSTGNLHVIVEEVFARYPSLRPEPGDEDVQRAVQAMEKASQPVIVAGGGASASSAGPAIVELAEMLSIPVATSVNGKGIISDDHPLSVGVVGTYSRRCANQTVSEADLVIYVGSHTGDQVTNEWTIPKPGTRIIQIDIDPSELGRNYPHTIGLAGDAQATVRKLIANGELRMANCELRTATTVVAPNREQWVQRAQRWVQEWRDEFEALLNSDAVPIRPERLCRELDAALPSDAVLVSDTGYSAIWTATMVNLTHPQQSYIRAAGSLGWAFPAALGAKCAAPDRPVLCFTGDGGFWYHLSELETASRWGINTVTIVNNNGGLGQGIPGINRAYGDRAGKREDLYRFRDVNFGRIAQEMGCLGIRVERPEEISGALEQALAADRPVVIDVVTDIGCHAPTPWTP